MLSLPVLPTTAIGVPAVTLSPAFLRSFSLCLYIETMSPSCCICMVCPASSLHPENITVPSRVAFTTEPSGAVMSMYGCMAWSYPCDTTPLRGVKKCRPSIGRFLCSLSAIPNCSSSFTCSLSRESCLAMAAMSRFSALVLFVALMRLSIFSGSSPSTALLRFSE